MTTNAIPKVAAVHDLSGVGKCSLTVVLPIMSSMGIEVCPLPTAVLSTHTGGFEGYTFRDMTGDMPAIIQHWKDIKVEFDAIYSGFLGSAEQIDILMDFIKSQRHEGLLVVVDPVMADNGQLYSTITAEMAERMKNLVGFADVITPNYTEAALLLGEKSNFDAPSDKELQDWLVRLSDMGAKKVVITGVKGENDSMYVATYDSEAGEFSKVKCDYIKGTFHGTGDIFASVMTSRLLLGDDLHTASSEAAGFISDAIKETCKYEWIKTRDGILFEKILAERTGAFNDKKD